MSDGFNLTWEGRTYSVNLGSVTAAEFRAIKNHCGLTAGGLVSAFADLRNLDADVGVALLWLAKKHAGENPAFEDDLPFFDFMAAVASIDEAEGDAPKA